jgi:putative addiction module component (TIGR02574 family)
MIQSLERWKAELAGLSVQDRSELAHFLLESLDSTEDVNAETAWQAELEQRASDIKSRVAVGKPAEQVFAELREKYS